MNFLDIPRLSSFLTDDDLRFFRTQVCPEKAAGRECPRNTSCQYSHCMSWARRNPYTVAYSSKLCPRVEFSFKMNRMRVKNLCPHGRKCAFSHTKEEQMYHPSVYKTQMCNQYPKCYKRYCPFAHGNHELRCKRTESLPAVEDTNVSSELFSQILSLYCSLGDTSPDVAHLPSLDPSFLSAPVAHCRSLLSPSPSADST